MRKGSGLLDYYSKFFDENTKLREESIELLKSNINFDIDNPDNLDPIYLPPTVYYRLYEIMILIKSNSSFIQNSSYDHFFSKTPRKLTYQTWKGSIDILPKIEENVINHIIQED